MATLSTSCLTFKQHLYNTIFRGRCPHRSEDSASERNIRTYLSGIRVSGRCRHRPLLFKNKMGRQNCRPLGFSSQKTIRRVYFRRFRPSGRFSRRNCVSLPGIVKDRSVGHAAVVLSCRAVPPGCSRVTVKSTLTICPLHASSCEESSSSSFK